jgi:hypothetical protein
VAVNPELVIFKTELAATRLLSSDRYNRSTVHFHKTFWKGQEFLLATKKKNKFCKMCIKVGENGRHEHSSYISSGHTGAVPK